MIPSASARADLKQSQSAYKGMLRIQDHLLRRVERLQAEIDALVHFEARGHDAYHVRLQCVTRDLAHLRRDLQCIARWVRKSTERRRELLLDIGGHHVSTKQL
jgi:hypothetical protein